MGLRSLALLAAFVAAVPLVLARPAFAQGMQGIWGEPIVTQEFERLVTVALVTTPSTGEGESLVGADSLDPRVRAWLVKLEPLHDAYLKELLEIRDQQAVPHLLRNGKHWAIGGTAAETRATNAEFDSIGDRRIDAERRFFDAIERELPPPCRPAVTTLRNARERARIEWVTAGLSGVDLIHLIDRLELPGAERAAIAPVLTDYEARLLGIARTLREIRKDRTEDLVRALDAHAAELAQIKGEGAEARQQRRSIVQKAVEWSAAARLDKAESIQELNLRTLEALMPLLSEASQRAVRMRIVVRALSGAGIDVESADQLASRLLARSDLGDVLHQQLEALVRSWRTKDNALLARLVDAHIEADRLSTAAGFDASLRDEAIAAGDRFSAVDQARTAAQRAFLKDLARALGTQRSQQLGLVPLAVAQARDVFFVPSPGESESPAELAEGDEYVWIAPELSEWPPPPATATAMQKIVIAFVRAGGFADRAAPLALEPFLEWCVPLSLTAEERAAVESRHAEYLDRWRKSVATHAAALEEAHLWKADDRTRVTGNPTKEDVARAFAEIDRLAETRRTLLPLTAALDDALFESIAPMFADDDRRARLAAMRVARRMGAFGVTSGLNNYWAGSGAEQQVNLGAIALQIEMPPAVRREFLRSLEHHAAELSEALLAQAAAAIEYDAANIRADAEGSRARHGDEEELEFAALLQVESTRRRACAPLAERVRRLTHMIGDEVAGALEGADRDSFLDTWHALLLPNDAPDQDDAAQLIDRALAMSGLSEAQRSAIEAISEEHRARHRHATERLVKLLMEFIPPTPDPRSSSLLESLEERRVGFERLALDFERREANAKARMHLRTVLTREQVARIAPLIWFM